MKVLHTADWHIGQLFYEYDRTYEHEQFLAWLTEILCAEKIDLLLISGDVFDISNPSAQSIRLFYTFLNNATRKCPDLQVIITAGNHDSASRLEAPRPLLESSRIHIVGTIEKDPHGQINYDKISVPLTAADGTVTGWCLAAPYLRVGDYPAVDRTDKELVQNHTYAAGVAAFYKEAYLHLSEKKTADQFIIALGHLHAAQAEITDMDSAERAIMGGIECVPVDAFHRDILYVALGHIHKAQRIGGKEHIRYSGSPIPLSFSELQYKHQVLCFELDQAGIHNLQSIEVPVSVPLLRIPKKHAPLPAVLKALEALPDTLEQSGDPYAPFLEIRILMDEPRPGLRYQVEKALEGKHIRLAKIDVRYPSKQGRGKNHLDDIENNLGELTPEDVFNRLYEEQFQTTPPANLIRLFNQAAREVAHKED